MCNLVCLLFCVCLLLTNKQGPFLPGYLATPEEPELCYGLQRLDHAVGNVEQLLPTVQRIMGFTGALQ